MPFLIVPQSARSLGLPQALFQGVSPASVAFLDIHVRRTHVVEDALNQVHAPAAARGEGFARSNTPASCRASPEALKCT